MRLRTLFSQLILSGAVVATASAAEAGTIAAGNSQSWLTQIKLTSAVWSGANGGSGVLVGVVDTGIDANNAELTGRVLSSSACVAVTFKCSNGVFDDNGHGTAVAAIAAGLDKSGSALMSGVAPLATVISEKALNAQGSGTDLDVANGLKKAADAGAKVINLSLTYIPSPSVVAAINYAAAKGATVVFAGGNSSVALNGGSNSTGLSAAALTHLVFVGSVNANNQLSSFSNTPGTGALVATNGAKASYASVWLMAPGERIVAPGLQYGSTAYAYWSGTSMAAPVITGSLALLDKTWPVLFRNGTTAAVLLASATQLGATPANATYGVGLVNLTAAFQPIGALSAVGPTGQSIPLGASSSAVLSSATLGSLKALSGALANYTVFDGFSRNFTANLSSLVSKTGSSAVTLSSLVYTPVWTNVSTFRDGSQLLTFGSLRDQTNERAWTRTAFAGADRFAPEAFAAYSRPNGLAFALGYGASPAGVMNRAAFGQVAAQARSDIGASTGLASLAVGGYAGAAVIPVGTRLRLATSWSATADVRDVAAPYATASRQASARSVVAAWRATDALTLGLDLTSLNERHGVFGAAYTPQTVLNLGDAHRSVSTGVSAALALGGGRSVVVDAATAATPAVAPKGGLIARVSALRADGYGVAFSQSDLFDHGDQLSLTLRRPLSLAAGSVDLAQTRVDEDGYNHTSVAHTALASKVGEVDVGVSYGRSLSRYASVRVDAAWRNNVEGLAGASDAAMRLAVQARF
jgi:subtilisin family serine protease